MNIGYGRTATARGGQHEEVARRLHRTFRDFCDATKIDMHAMADAASACGYTDWVYETGKARFGTDNILTHDAVIGAAHRLKQGTVGTFFRFLHEKEADVMKALGIPTTHPARQLLSASLAEAAALPPVPRRSRG